jgi:exonuclease III
VLELLRDPNQNGKNELLNAAQLVDKQDRWTYLMDDNNNNEIESSKLSSIIDHVLLTQDLYNLISSVHISNQHDFTAVSDHTPVIVTFQQEAA